MSDLLQLSKTKNDCSFRNMSEQLLSAEKEARSTTSLQTPHSVAHCLKETNNKIRGSEDTKVLKQHNDSLQAHYRGMVGSEDFSSTRHKIFPSSSSYRIHDQVVEPTPKVFDADHDLLAQVETTVTVKASEFKAVESLVTSSLGVLSYIEHFVVASTKLFQQLLVEVGRCSLQRSASERQSVMLVGSSWQSMLQLGTFSHCWGDWCQYQI